MATILEQISARIQQIAEGVLAGEVSRPLRVQWVKAVASDGTAVVRQERTEPVYKGLGDGIYRQQFEISLVSIQPDASAESVETESPERTFALIGALQQDEALASLAMCGGVHVQSVAPLYDEEGGLLGRVLRLAVTYSHRTADPAAAGVC